MNDLNTVESEASPSEPSPVLLVPGHLFFVDRIELPDSLERSELDDFAELSLESLAPFPVEHLYWGYLYSESSGNILLYATYKDRLKAQGFKDLESYLWVLPDFATLFGSSFPETTTVELIHEASLSRMVFAKGEVLPQVVDSKAIDAQAPETAAADTLQLCLQSTELSENGLPTFHFEPMGSSSGESTANFPHLSPSENALWRADIRSSDFKKTERSARKLTARIARATGYCVLFALFMILLEGALFLAGLWLERQDALIAAQAPEVRRIEDKQSLMNKLDQVAQNELRPIAILGALNDPRPEGVYFTSTVTEGQNRIIIDGIANTITELNNYIAALLASGNFQQPERERTLTRGGQTTFTATFEYLHRNEETTDEPAQSETESENETDEDAAPEAEPEEEEVGE